MIYWSVYRIVLTFCFGYLLTVILLSTCYLAQCYRGALVMLNVGHSSLICYFQIVEVSQLISHQMKHCKRKDKLSVCPRCSELIPFEKFHRHLQNNKCPRECVDCSYVRFIFLKAFYGFGSLSNA